MNEVKMVINCKGEALMSTSDRDADPGIPAEAAGGENAERDPTGGEKQDYDRNDLKSCLERAPPSPCLSDRNVIASRKESTRSGEGAKVSLQDVHAMC